MNGVDETAVDDPTSFTHHFGSVNGIRMHYVDEGQGPPVLLLHGYPFLWYLWRHQIKALAAAGYRVVAPDQRGAVEFGAGERDLGDDGVDPRCHVGNNQVKAGVCSLR